MATKPAFCVVCQEVKEHELSYEGVMQDITLTCDCGHFIKAPYGMDKESLDAFLTEHEEANVHGEDYILASTPQQDEESLSELI